MSPYPSRFGACTLAVIVALALASCQGAPASRLPQSSPPPPVAVDLAATVVVSASRVITPCFSYRLPDTSFTLVEGSMSCNTAVAFGADALSTVHVRAVTVPGTPDELAVLALGGDPDGRVETVHLAGRELVRAVAPMQANAIEIASYVVPYPESGLTGAGDLFTGVVLTAPLSEDYEAFVGEIVASLERPDGAPL